MGHTDRDIYRGNQKRNRPKCEPWEPFVPGEYFRGTVPSWRKKMVRKAERSAYRNAMQRGDYEAAEMQADRNSLRIKNVYIINI